LQEPKQLQASSGKKAMTIADPFREVQTTTIRLPQSEKSRYSKSERGNRKHGGQ